MKSFRFEVVRTIQPGWCMWCEDHHAPAEIEEGTQAIRTGGQLFHVECYKEKLIELGAKCVKTIEYIDERVASLA